MEGAKIFTQDAKNVEILSTFFSDPVNNIKIPEFEEVNPFAEKGISSDIESNFQIYSIQVSKYHCYQ